MLRRFRRDRGFTDSSPEEVAELLREGKAQLVDVRTAGEYASGHVPGARLIPLDQLDRRLDQIDPEAPVVVYCRSGHRSRRAARALADRGFQEVHNMAGGIRRWKGKVER